MLISTRPGAHRSTTSADDASPPTISAADSSPTGDSMPMADGVWLNTVIWPMFATKSWNSVGDAATASGTTTSRAPKNSAPQISRTETSKEYDCHWVTANGTGWAARRGSKKPAILNSWVTLRCVIATPLGTPVVPDV